MTEKNYGGASPHGLKEKNIKNSGDSLAPVGQKKQKKGDFEGEELTPMAIESYKKAGKIVKDLRVFVRGFVKKGMNILEIAETIEKKIIEAGGEPAFPVNISIDEIAAHYTPTKNDTRVASGLCKVDFGVSIEGYVADNAISFDFSEDGKYKEMIEVNEKYLNEVLDNLKVESNIKDIGNHVAKIEDKFEYKIIKNLSGHSLEQDNLHAGLSVLNYKNENNFKLKNIVIAIEPFLTTGKGEIYESQNSEIYILQDVKTPRDRDARKLLEFVQENYGTLPFCKRWLENSPELKSLKINFALSVLTREGTFYNFPVLVEKDKKPVSQAEHTVLFSDKVYVITRD